MIKAQTTLDSKARIKKGKLSLPRVSKESPEKRRRTQLTKKTMSQTRKKEDDERCGYGYDG